MKFCCSTPVAKVAKTFGPFLSSSPTLLPRRTFARLPLRILFAFFSLAATSLLLAAEPLDDVPQNFVVNHCVDCHSGESAEANVDLDVEQIDWADAKSAKLWSRVHHVLESNDMPPAEIDDRPAETDRQAMLGWLDKTLTKQVPPGGSVLRRLNRQEYENSIRSVFQFQFKVPNSFPADTEAHGFDNIGEGLVLSPPLMAQYVDLATSVADQIVPPLQKTEPTKTTSTDIGPSDFSLNFTTGYEIDGVLRMVSGSEPLSRGSVWPNRFEARVSGIYDVAIQLSAFKPTEGHVPEVRLLARKTTGSNFAKANTLRKLAEFKIDSQQPAGFKATVELLRGETIVIHYENGPIYSIVKDRTTYLNRFSRQLHDTFRADPELGLAWMKAGYQRSDRGWSWWKRIEAQRPAARRELADFDVDSDEVKEFAMAMAKRGVNTEEALCCFFFFKGPGVNVHKMSITGPTREIEDEQMRQQRQRTEQFLGTRGGFSDSGYAAKLLRPVLEKAFRRPVSKKQLSKYVSIATQHIADGQTFREGMHLAIRAALCSPNFIYRGQRSGKLDDYDLASRLSYFLTSHPPDASLRKLAASGQLSQRDVLRQQTLRLLKQSKVSYFLDSFVGQWLDLRLLPQIMPDPRLLKWTTKDLAAIQAETQMFVEEILKENLPLETFIDADFTYLNRRNAKLYDIDFGKSDQMKRVQLPADSIRGGILTQASVLMATANGVDTQPVLRGAWMLENVFGTPTAPPPADVPVIEPDTTGAKTIRELSDRHKADRACARCHQKIDPPGFVMESFDPVGRFRKHYPVYKTKADKTITEKGQRVDSAGTLPDGTSLGDIQDLKRYLIENPEIFSRCLTEKLMVYATGREMNYGDKKVIDQIVQENEKNGSGFQDLIVQIVLSESFGAK